MARTTDTDRSNTGAAAIAEASAEERLHALLHKIRAAQNVDSVVEPGERPPSCRACYQRGWQAALKHLLNG